MKRKEKKRKEKCMIKSFIFSLQMEFQFAVQDQGREFLSLVAKWEAIKIQNLSILLMKPVNYGKSLHILFSSHGSYKMHVYIGRKKGEICSLVLNWIDDIKNPEKWQDGSFYTLCAMYSMLSFLALIQLIRIQVRIPEYGWTTQKVFHLMNFVVTLLRAFIFGFHKFVFQTRPKALELIILNLPALLFFSAYTLLVLFWAEIYHQARSLPIGKLRPAYYIINAIVYFIQACMWIYIRLSKNAAAVEISTIFFSVISLLAALGFLIYGGRLFIMLQRFPIESASRQKKLQEVGYVMGICCTCFLIRSFMDVLSAFDKDADLDVLDHPLLILVYYMMVEIVPSSLVLFILRKVPPRRVSDQYQSVN